MDSFTLSNEAVTKLDTDSRMEQQTVPHVTRREARIEDCDKTDQLDMVRVRVVREHLPSDPANLTVGARERLLTCHHAVSTKLIGGTIVKTERQQAHLPLDQGTEFRHAPAQRIRDSLRNSTHKGRSSESSASSTLFNHTWISS